MTTFIPSLKSNNTRNNTRNNTLRIAIQKSGRMYDNSMRFLQQNFGIDARPQNGRLDYYDPQQNITVFFCREKDIPQLVANNIVDLGIAGMNTVKESGCRYDQTITLGFSQCRLSLAACNTLPGFGPDDFNPQALNGQTIATSYPNILQEYLDEQDIEATIYELSGSVESAPALGIADVICDLVETGTTLRENNLREITTIMQSEAIALLGRDYPLLENPAALALQDFQKNRFPEAQDRLSSPALFLDRNCRIYN